MIRLGLHDTADLKRDLLAGRTIRRSGKNASPIYFTRYLARVAAMEENPSAIIILGNPRDISQIIGQKRET